MKHHLSRLSVAALALGAAAIPSTLAGGAVHAELAPGNPDAAVYEGETLDLSESWGTARACAELGSVTECFDDETELLAAHPELRLAAPTKGGFVTSLLAYCSTSLRLYDGTSYAGTVLYLSTRGLVLNLSNYGFDNKTSSRRNGACAATLFSGASGGGSSLGIPANSQAASMPTGWNNVASSVYIA
jgi:hypothetical protein